MRLGDVLVALNLDEDVCIHDASEHPFSATVEELYTIYSHLLTRCVCSYKRADGVSYIRLEGRGL